MKCLLVTHSNFPHATVITFQNALIVERLILLVFVLTVPQNKTDLLVALEHGNIGMGVLNAVVVVLVLIIQFFVVLGPKRIRHRENLEQKKQRKLWYL